MDRNVSPATTVYRCCMDHSFLGCLTAPIEHQVPR
jgi:hypothetical protein